MVGPIPAYAETVGGTADAVTIFVGSLLFTTAGYLTYLQVMLEDGHRWVGWTPHHLGFGPP